jgi:hypothetical protein
VRCCGCGCSCRGKRLFIQASSPSSPSAVAGRQEPFQMIPDSNSSNSESFSVEDVVVVGVLGGETLAQFSFSALSDVSKAACCGSPVSFCDSVMVTQLLLLIEATYSTDKRGRGAKNKNKFGGFTKLTMKMRFPNCAHLVVCSQLSGLTRDHLAAVNWIGFWIEDIMTEM